MEPIQQILQNPYVLPAIAAVAVLLLFFGLSRIGRARDEVIEQRLGRYARIEGGEEGEALIDQPSAMDGLEAVVSQRGFAANLQTDLARADLRLRMTEFVMITILSVLVFFLLGQLIFRTPLIGLVFGIVGFFAPRIYVNIRKRRRLNAFNDQLADTISLLANSLRSGFSIVQSMETVAQQSGLAL
jgi:tight adherence protein B